jgi:hypothetical protein
MKRIMILLGMLIFQTSPAATVTFNGGVTYQTIDGFGATINHRGWHNDELKPVIDAVVDQAGMTLFKIIYDKTDWEAANDNTNAYAMNWAYYNPVYSSPEFQKMWDMAAYFNQKGISNGLMFNFQGNGSAWLGSPALKTGMEAEWAEMVASLLIYARQASHLQFGLVGPDNEMDQTPQGVNMTASQYATGLHYLSQILDTNGMSDLRFVGPDMAAGGTTYMPQMLADSVVMSKVAHFGVHSYSGGGAGSAGVANYLQGSAYPDRNFWMSECGVWCAACDSGVLGTYDWTYCKGTAEYLMQHLLNNAAAEIVWEVYDSQYNYYSPLEWSFWGLFGVDDTNAVVRTYTPRKTLYTLSQLSKFVRPGAQRIGVNGSVSSISPLLAFKHTGLGQVTIVGINTSASAVALSGALASLPAVSHLDLYYTSPTVNVAAGGSATVNANGTFSATIPANCVFTLTGSTGVNVALTNPVNGAQFTAPATIPLAATATPAAGNIALVWFYNGETPLGEATIAPYGFTWNNVPMGNYALTAVAGDTLGNVSTSAVVNVTVVGPLAQIDVTPANAIVAPSGQQQFTATGTYPGGSPQNITSQVTWMSSNPGVATINSSGLATAVSVGTTTISAGLSGVNGGATLAVQVPPLAISTTSLTNGVVNVGYSATLTASGGTLPYTWSIADGSLPTGLTLNASTGAITGTPGSAGAFNFTVQVSDAGSPVQSATNALRLTVASLPPVVTIWPSTAVPARVDAGADSAVELGVKFRSDVAGTITGIRFYKAAANTGAHIGNLWTSAGTRLATATFSGETASGWQQVLFATPVAITANTVYVASYHGTVGHYSFDLNYFTSKGADNPPLHALTNGVSGGNGVYAYGTSSTFPTVTYGAVNYWVDVVFQPAVARTLNSIAVAPANPSILTTASQQFTATGTYSDGSTQNITSQATWRSSNPGVATVTAGGVATGVSAGTTSISAALAGVTNSTVLTVLTPPTLASIVVTPANPAILVGASQAFTATGTYSDGSVQDISRLATWTSSSTGVATINLNGLASGLSAGTTTISAAMSTVNGSTTLAVQAPLVVTTTSLPSGTVDTGYNTTLTASGGSPPYNWSLAGGVLPPDLTLNAVNGAITGIPSVVGTSNLTVQVSDASIPIKIATKALSLTIAPALTSMAVTPANPTNQVSTAQQFTATGTYSDGSTQDITSQVTWSSSTTAVATINASGLATAISPGDTTISAALAGVTNSTVLTVLTPPTLASIVVTPANPAILVGASQAFTATGTYSDGSVQDITRLATWKSSSTGVATINANGLASGLSAGTTTISAAMSTVTGSTTLAVQAPLVVTTSSLPSGTLGAGYNTTLIASGGSPPYNWSLAGGVIPPGLTLNAANGAITGTPSVVGTSNFTVQASDASIPVKIATKPLSLTIAPALTSMAVTPANPTNRVGTTQQFTATGTYSDGSAQNLSGQATWTSSSTAVATINASGLATGVVPGITTISAALGGVSGNTTLTIQPPPLVITTASLPSGTVSTTYTTTLAASGGTAPYTWSLAGGALPPGLTLGSSGAITGTPTTAGTSNFTVRATDAGIPAQTTTRLLGLTINSAGTSGLIGNTTEGTVTDNLWYNGAWINAGRFQAASNMIVSTMLAKVVAVPGKYKCAIYSDVSSRPSQVLGSTAEVSNPASGWQSFPLTSSVALTKGSYYWLAIWSGDANARVYYSGSNGTLRWGLYSYGTWPNPISTSGGGNLNYCIYAR